MTTTTTISLSEVDVMTALVAFLQAVLPSGTPVIQANISNVAMPKGPFVSMTHVGTKRLSTNVDTPNGSLQQVAMLVPTQYTVQLDFYGPVSADWAHIVQAMFRDDAGAQLFPATVVPLYADDPTQMTMVTGEETYLQRWKVDAVMQFNPVITTAQQSALALSIVLDEID